MVLSVDAITDLDVLKSLESDLAEAVNKHRTDLTGPNRNQAMTSYHSARAASMGVLVAIASIEGNQEQVEYQGKLLLRYSMVQNAGRIPDGVREYVESFSPGIFERYEEAERAQQRLARASLLSRV